MLLRHCASAAFVALLRLLLPRFVRVCAVVVALGARVLTWRCCAWSGVCAVVTVALEALLLLLRRCALVASVALLRYRQLCCCALEVVVALLRCRH